jgi:asparagine synthase (glutamine-hydrolysing)
MRPFYYFADERRFLFGTELKAMLALPEIPREEEPARYALFVTGVHTTDLTRFRSLRLLRPAHTLSVERSRLQLRRYWSLDPEREMRFRRDEDYVEAFEEIFQRALDARLRSTGRVGCMLSGGLDATTMLGFALGSRACARDRLTAYTWALRKGDDWRIPDEREYVDAFLREHPLDHHYLVLPSERIFEENPAIEHLEDGPIVDYQHCPMTDTLRHARERNIRALLLGDGGDETASHGAHDYFMQLMLHLDWRALRREAQADSWAGAPERQVWKSYFLRPFFRRDILRAPFRAQKYHEEFRAELLDPGLAGIPLTRELIAKSDLLHHWEQARPRLSWAWRNPVRCNQINLLTGADVMAKIATSCNYSVLHGIECRFPYLDRRVVEYCVALPLEQHRFCGWARLLLRRCADKRIPAKIARRRDKSSTWPDVVRGISRNDAKLRGCFARWAANPRVARCLDLSKMQRHLQAFNELAQTGACAEQPPAGMFCQAVFLGQFLERSNA